MMRWVQENEALRKQYWPGPELFQRFMEHVGKKAEEAANQQARNGE
jgi:hypothetical protein